MAVAAFADPDRSPLRPRPRSDVVPPYDEWVETLYLELLGRLTELCDHPDRYAHLWAEEDVTLTESEKALARGAITIEEVPDLDLAVVTLPDRAELNLAGGHRFGGEWVTGVHPLALHNATDRGALLVFEGRRPEFRYRYESWVQFRSRVVRPRVDLVPLAERLDDEEGAGKAAVAGRGGVLAEPDADGGRGAQSALEPSRVRALVERHLRESPPAWDPYRITR